MVIPIVDRNTNHNATLCLRGFLQHRRHVVRCLSSQSISLALPCHTSLPQRFLLDGNKQAVSAKYHLIELVDVLGSTGSQNARCSAALAR